MDDGTFAQAGVQQGWVTALGLGGALSHSSAVQRHGWPVLSCDERVHVTVLRGGRARAAQHPGVVLHHAALTDQERHEGTAGVRRTAADCVKALPAREALAVADSILRNGNDRAWLSAVAADRRGPGAARARLTVQRASPLAANPFESALRRIGHDVASLALRPQVEVATTRGSSAGSTSRTRAWGSWWRPTRSPGTARAQPW